MALVTGAARRVGKAIALALGRQGYDILFTYRNSEEAARRTEEEIRDLDVETYALQVDFDRLQDCRKLLDFTQQQGLSVSVLVNNASSYPTTPLKRLAESDSNFDRALNKMVAVHMRGPLFLSLHLGRKMKAEGQGHIINLIDQTVAGRCGYPHYSLYLSTKYGLLGISQALAAELAPEVCVNCIAPGPVLPPPGMKKRSQEAIAEKIPLEKWGGAEEIAGDVIHLIRSGFKTGSIIVSDGGISGQNGHTSQTVSRLKA